MCCKSERVRRKSFFFSKKCFFGALDLAAASQQIRIFAGDFFVNDEPVFDHRETSILFNRILAMKDNFTYDVEFNGSGRASRFLRGDAALFSISRADVLRTS